MWECSKCREKIQDDFDVCWSCGTSRDGTEDPDFHNPAEESSLENERREPMSGNLVTVDRCKLPVEAQIKKGRLEAEGIEVFVADEFDWLFAAAKGGIKIQVAAEDAERAQAILDEFHQEHGTDYSEEDNSE